MSNKRIFRFGIKEKRLIFQFEGPKKHPLEQGISDSVDSLHEKISTTEEEEDIIDQDRIVDDINKLKVGLLNIENKDIKNKALQQLDDALGVLHTDFDKDESQKQERLSRLNDRVYSSLQPILSRLLAEKEGVTKLEGKGATRTMEFNGEKVTLEIEGLGTVKKITMPGKNIVVDVPNGYPTRVIERILINIQSIQNIIPKHLQKDAQSLIAINGETFTFTAEVDGVEESYRVTPFELLEKIPKADYAKQYEAEQKAMQVEMDIINKNMPRGPNGMDVSSKEFKKLYAEIQQLTFDLDVGTVKNAQELLKKGEITKEDLEKITLYQAMNKAIYRAEKSQRKLRVLKDKKYDLEQGYTNGERFNTVDDSQETLEVRSLKGDDVYHNKKGDIVRTRTYINNSLTTGSPERYSDTTEYHEGKSSTTTSRLKDTNQITSKSVRDTDGYSMESTYFEKDGNITSVSYPKFGVQMEYRDGKPHTIQVNNNAYAIIYCEKVLLLKDGESILKKIAAGAPGEILARIDDISKLGQPLANELVTIALNNADEKVLKKILQDLDKYEHIRKTFSSPQQLEQFTKECERRLEKYRIAKILTRASYGEELPKKMRELWEDPALSNILEVKDEWIPKDHPLMKQSSKGGNEELALIQMKAIIARNLYFTKLPITKENVQKEFERVAKEREALRSTPLFQGRNVVFGAHEEVMHEERRIKESGDKHAFGKEALVTAMQKQIGPDGSFTLIRPELDTVAEEDKIENLTQAKQKILDQIRTTPPPFTFVFDGHGGPDAIYLSDGSIDGFSPGVGASDSEVQEFKDTISISAQEIGEAFAARDATFGKEIASSPEKRDVLILSCCFNANFIRNMYRHMGSAPKPVAIGQSEYNQYSLYFKPNKYGSPFLANTVGAAKEDGPATLGTVFDKEFTNMEEITDEKGEVFEGNTNPSVYVPDENNVIMQITKTDDDSVDPSRESIA
ncbi:MAG: hypothetical protein HOG89_02040 [Candidatus Peribacter sp.]|jgi:hypothetical protein|nr:hypothetical protein [Candidatus Peribacter sp.]MBT7337128.1 hypothetical protein [Candidatus Peregrinibacteria bacterium]MBT4392857.1 hypothetical protein [Candidatus Peribacter sp.]MBT5149407.1 hypothetical protein [Candidatus Peribacter sp.]MBT5637540.1 hypothetical protein [Candidatus Peribacter sp.]